MWQAETRIDLDAIRHNLDLLRTVTAAEMMAVVKADGYGHGLIASARAAIAGGATWLGACTLAEAHALRDAGITTPTLAWLLGPEQPLVGAIGVDIDLSVASMPLLADVVAAARQCGRCARIHLKLDTGLSRGGAPPAQWEALVESAAKAQADGSIEIIALWSHFARSDEVGHPSIEAQLETFAAGRAVAARYGVDPPYRHMANSAAILTRPESHFDLVRPGIAMYGLSPIPRRDFGLRPAMTAAARVMLTKRVPTGSGVSYGHTYRTQRETTLAVVPLGYGDGVPRAASNTGPVWLAGKRRTVAGRVCMDQFVVDCGQDEVAVGDEVILFGPGDRGEPTATDWAEASGTINHEIVTRFGSLRIPRRYDGLPA